MSNKYNLDSVCMSYRHDYGTLSQTEQGFIRLEVKEIIEAYEKELAEPSKCFNEKNKLEFNFDKVTFNFMPDPNDKNKLLPSIYLPEYLPAIENNELNFQQCLSMYLKKCKVKIILECE